MFNESKVTVFTPILFIILRILSATGCKPRPGSTRLPPTTLRVLANHLRHCHDHFTYEFCFDQLGNFHIVIKRDKTADLDFVTLAQNLRERYFYFNIGKSKKTLFDFAVPVVSTLVSVSSSASSSTRPELSSRAEVEEQGSAVEGGIPSRNSDEAAAGPKRYSLYSP
jgi:hypothetical protein